MLSFTRLAPSETGIQFKNELNERPELNILTYLYYYNGGGVIIEDFNQDSLPDIYLGGNQVADALYINQGNMKFQEVTAQSGISNPDGWTTGISHVDINGDGLQDIYICKASGYRGLKGRNLLYVNIGADPDGIPRFEERAADYGLDFSGLATQAAFFDYDLDGDLDLFLLNHSVHPNRNYGKGTQRTIPDPLSGDRFYRNDDGFFTDVSREAGIFQGKAGYGLGVGISDLNSDGYPDMYIGNDFFENDYLYINNGDGTFRELISSGSQEIGHSTHFSMGNDLADINNDGHVDILSLDMLPEDLITYKTSGLEYAYPIYRQYLNNGFAPQYMQNTLQLNTGRGSFSEIAYLSGIAATEWSWGGLLADLDNDGFKDLFVTNGIKGATNDMDYMNFIANEDIQRRIDKGMQDADLPLTREIPPKKVPNYVFQNNGDLTFTDRTSTWIGQEPSFSNGSAYADLDQDGDLDLLVNNLDQVASLYQNNLETGNWIRLTFSGIAPNTKGIGARVIAYTAQGVQVYENFTARGYLSGVPGSMLIGLDQEVSLDSLLVIWPGGSFEKHQGIPAGQTLTLEQKQARGDYYSRPAAQNYWRATDTLLPFVHRENTSLDFDREPLIAYAKSNEGPDISIGDINNDGAQDIFVSGAKRQSAGLFLQGPAGAFSAAESDLFANDAINEDTGHLFFDADSDGWNELLVISGGNEFTDGPALRPRLYRNNKGVLRKDTTAFTGFSLNASAVDSIDMDLDGDLDIFISSDAVSGAFGKTPQHGLFQNDGTGHFTDVTTERIPELQTFGGIDDFSWADINADGLADLVVAGHWGPIAVFENTGSGWKYSADNGLDLSNGWWNCIEVADIDNDGDSDLIAGNWGLNSKFRATRETPLTLYRSDFDQNGSVEPLVTYYHNGVETPFASKDELVKQMPFLNKKHRTYRSFANASLEELFGADALKAAVKKEVFELRSCVFLNDGKGNFTKVPLPVIGQASIIYDFLCEDLDGDGYKDLMLIGNLHELSTQLGRLDAFQGVVLRNEKDGTFTWAPELSPPISGAGRVISRIRIGDNEQYIIGRNNASPLFLTKHE
ncbi:VCBS repeat-containing protein [Robiginitalea aurantiaca]|uniref:VCBS repeat-containing protein n=1 Tax=Robiginitalea aurantiaca TaxID=3056915 RepID=A0ABT7WER7_9FLAO|nr:VCBS repeat-containing protein [Robiginitalea aurantiaca]MDM9631414.1 VCBS repeat-containing protein [Robiginitalea aurantiaca]